MRVSKARHCRHYDAFKLCVCTVPTKNAYVSDANLLNRKSQQPIDGECKFDPILGFLGASEGQTNKTIMMMMNVLRNPVEGTCTCILNVGFKIQE